MFYRQVTAKSKNSKSNDDILLKKETINPQNSNSNNQYINDSQIELDRLLAGVDANDDTFLKTGANLTSKTNTDNKNVPSLAPTGANLTSKANTDNKSVPSLAPTGANLMSKTNTDNKNVPSLAPTGANLTSKNNADNANGTRMSPGGDSL